MTLVNMDDLYHLTASGTYVVFGPAGRALAARLEEVGAFVDFHERVEEGLQGRLEVIARDANMEGAIVFADALLGGGVYDERSLPGAMARLSLLLLTLTQVLEGNAGLVVLGPDSGGLPPEATFLSPVGALVWEFDSGRGKALRTNVLATTGSSDGPDEGRVSDAVVYLMMESMITGMMPRLGGRYLHSVL